MIRKLRKKFLLAALVAVFLVLLVLIGAINILNYRSLVAEADETLQILASNGGAFPRQMFREQDLPPAPGEGQEPLSPPPEDGRGEPFEERRGGYGELAYQSRFYTAWFDGEGALSRLDLENLASLTEAEAASLAEEVYAAGRERGFSGDYRYCRTELGGETMLLLLNCQRELATFRSFLYASVGISLAGVLGVFLLLWLFSGRIVRPIAESYEKQRRFITDAGHELKTPIAIIQADADVLESEQEGENEWISDIRRQTRRLTELTAGKLEAEQLDQVFRAVKVG